MDWNDSIRIAADTVSFSANPFKVSRFAAAKVLISAGGLIFFDEPSADCCSDVFCSKI